MSYLFSAQLLSVFRRTLAVNFVTFYISYSFSAFGCLTTKHGFSDPVVNFVCSLTGCSDHLRNQLCTQIIVLILTVCNLVRDSSADVVFTLFILLLLLC